MDISSSTVRKHLKKKQQKVRQQLIWKARLLEYLTVGWNVVEAGVAVGSGIVANSSALIGFGLDSLIESASGLALLWRFWKDSDSTAREARALRLVGISFLLLASYVAYDAIKALWLREPPEASYIGMAIAGLSLVVMPVLARAKRRVAAALNSRALEADSRQTDICAYLSAILLVGLGLNAWLGWWWADPVASLAMVPIIGWEGWKALNGEACCEQCAGVSCDRMAGENEP